MNGLRVVLITRRYWPLVSDEASLAADLAHGLRGGGAEVIVLTAQGHVSWPPQITDCGVRVLRLPTGVRSAWGGQKYLRSLGSWLRKNASRYDAAMVLGMREEAESAMAATAGSNKPVILVALSAGLEGDCHWQLEAAHGERVKNACMKAAALVASDCMQEAELIAAGYPRERIRQIPPGVPELPAATTWYRDQVRAALVECNRAFYMPQRTPLVVHTGPLVEGRGLETLIAAWPQVLVKYPLACLWLTGGGPLRGKLIQMCERLRLHQRVLLPGTFDQPANVAAAADLYVAPAPMRGPCMNLLRAMSMGVPVVAAVDGNLQRHPLVEHERTGVLAGSGDATALAEGMLRLMNDPLEAQRLGDAARQHVQAKLPMSQCVQRYQELLEQVTRPESFHQPQPVSL